MEAASFASRRRRRPAWQRSPAPGFSTFERYQTAEVEVAGAVDHTHSAPAGDRLDPVAGKAGPGSELDARWDVRHLGILPLETSQVTDNPALGMLSLTS